MLRHNRCGMLSGQASRGNEYKRKMQKNQRVNLLEPRGKETAARVQKTIKASTKGLVPYSLRHGYAWRAVKYEHYQEPVPIRDLASYMGHDPKTHMKHYGFWTDDEQKKKSHRRTVGVLMTANQ